MKHIILVVALALTTQVTFAQNKTKTVKKQTIIEAQEPAVKTSANNSEFYLSKITPRFGMMASNFGGDTAFNRDRNGIHIGALAELATPVKPLAFESGLIYEQLGGYQKTSTNNTTTESGVRFNYIKVPVYAKYYLPMNSEAQVYLKTGPSLSFMVSKTEFLNSTSTNKEQEIEDKFVNKTQFAAEIGGGTSIPLGAGSFVFELIYLRGLSRVNAEGNDSTYNSAVNFAAGYSINL